MAGFKTSALKNLPFFEDNEDDDLELTLRDVRHLQFKKGTRIYSQGDLPTEFHLLVAGRIRSSMVSSNGQELIVEIWSANDMFDLGALQKTTSHATTAVAMVDCDVITWPIAVFRRLLASVPRLATGLSLTLSSNLRRSQELSMQLSLPKVDQRIACALLRLADQPTSDLLNKQVTIDTPLTRREVAQMSATTLHTVSRTLRNWANEGLVETSSKQITILEFARLQGISNGKA